MQVSTTFAENSRALQVEFSGGFLFTSLFTYIWKKDTLCQRLRQLHLFLGLTSNIDWLKIRLLEKNKVRFTLLGRVLHHSSSEGLGSKIFNKEVIKTGK